MKKITFFLMLLTVSLGYSQVDLVDFETALPAGAVNAFEGLTSATVIADPGNGSNTVLELVSATGGQPWQGAELIFQDELADLSSDITVRVDVFANQAFDLFAKVEDKVQNTASGDAATATAYTAAMVGTWQTLTFTFNQNLDGTGTANGQYSQIAFFPNWNIGAVGWNNPPATFTILLDNVNAVAGLALPLPNCNDGIMNQDETGVDCGGMFCAPCAVPPTTAATTPVPRDANNVISFYSDEYTDTTVESYDAGFCGFGNTAEVSIAGTNMRTYSTSACVGWEFTNNRVNASTMTYVHFDYYTSDVDLLGKVFNVKFSDWAGTGEEDSALQININDGTAFAPSTGSWVEVDLEINFANPLFAGSATRSDLAQFVMSSNLDNVWIDNVYMHNNDESLSTDEFATAQFRVYPNPTAANWTISANNTINKVTVYDILGKQVSTLTTNASEVEISTTNMNPGMYFATIESDKGTQTVKLIKE